METGVTSPLSSSYAALYDALNQIPQHVGKSDIEQQKELQKSEEFASFLQQTIKDNYLDLSISEKSLKKISQFVHEHCKTWEKSDGDILLKKNDTSLDLDMQWHKQTESLLIQEVAIFQGAGAQKRYSIWINSDGVLLACGTTTFEKYTEPQKRIVESRLELEEEILQDIKGNAFVVQYYSTIKKINNISILTEFCNLRDCVEFFYQHEGNIDIQDTLQITYDVLRGLEYLQQKQIAHRDIKLANIFVEVNKKTNRGICARIGDFGFAVYANRLKKDTPLYLCGSAEYYSPELFLLPRTDYAELYRNDFSSLDMWSFGICLYGLHNGTQPPWSPLLLDKINKYGRVIDSMHDTMYSIFKENHQRGLAELLRHRYFDSERLTVMSKKINQFTLLLLEKLPERTTSESHTRHYKTNRPTATEALAHFAHMFKDELSTLEN